MIFVTIGNGWQFDRLLIMVDKAIEILNYDGEIVYQIGPSKYKPKYGRYCKLLDKSTYESFLNRADFVICHAGEGIVVECIMLRKKPIVLPRLMKYNETKNDHQVQLVEVFKKMNLINVITDYLDICQFINSYDNIVKNIDLFPPFMGKEIENIFNKLVE